METSPLQWQQGACQMGLEALNQPAFICPSWHTCQLVKAALPLRIVNDLEPESFGSKKFSSIITNPQLSFSHEPSLRLRRI
jgi:hypothetical protein